VIEAKKPGASAIQTKDPLHRVKKIEIYPEARTLDE
jgi:hypothetical protein